MANFADDILRGMDGLFDAIKTSKGESLLRSNQAINKVGKFVLGEVGENASGIRGTLQYMSEAGGGKKFMEAAKAAHMTGYGLNYKAIAGTYVGAATVGRLATGGGLYKDRNGNNNLIGVPFI